ncbi:nitrous oxide reductase family maturation protein NosD [Gillisia limnaea]|uniref:Parallel beta-helix repeat containing protein n=1 Tax=Gillisia limnaea (strain DSM 15749 / LMG 21470 / R-8282) TaxID=865937 RepID=H2BY03_GILLR|nr:nitrous oxide reductase family maturation protein NosD [Gillisia limnaea]EHQ03209.1 parallel beta-helix repeat containing protein [Gillisia limnaea DSM 15749]
MKYFISIIFLLNLLPTLAGEIRVCSPCEVKTVKQAIEIAQSGDTIIIEKGVYEEFNINIINKTLHIKGVDYPVIDAGMNGTAFGIKANGVTIEGLKIINIGRSYTKDFAAILLNGSENFTIKNNILENVFFGFLIEKSVKGVIEGNRIKSEGGEEANSGNGIHLWSSSEIIVRNNHVQGMRDGIYIEFGKNCEILNNLSEKNIRYGLHFMFSDRNSYIGNTFEDNGAGVAVMFSKFIEMKKNLFRKSWGSASYGLLLKEISDATLEHNIFEDNTIAVNADGTTRVLFIENDFKNNGYAIKVHGGAYSTSFTRNNFLYNSFDVAYSGRLNDNSFTGNYWSDYTGYDLNKDKIGDVPFRPVKLFSYLVNKTPEAIVLLRSIFIDLVDFSEKVSPIFTPAELIDHEPQMNRIKW